MVQKYWNTMEAAELLGINRRTLNSWFEKGIVKPFFRAGKRRVDLKLSKKNLRECAIVQGLRRAGVSMQHIRRAAQHLQEAWGHNPMSEGAFLVLSKEGRKDIIKVMGEGQAIDLSRRALKDYETGQLSLFPLLHVKIELDRINRVLEESE